MCFIVDITEGQHYNLCFLQGSPSLRSPTENSIASLVSAAELVKSKAEAQGSSGKK